jgi:hypothetical protein
MLARHRADPAAQSLPRVALILAFVLAIALPLLFATVAAAAGGATIWSRQFSMGSRGDAFLDVARGPGDVYYCTGITRATEETSTLVLVKYKSDGTRLWARLYQAPATKGSAGARVAVDADGDVIVAGTVGVAPPASATGRDVVVLKYSPDGVRKWVQRWDGAANGDDYAADLALDSAGTAYVAGGTRGATTGQDYLVVAVNPAGGLRWAWTYDGPGVRDYATGVAVDGGGNCYVTGSSQGKGATTAPATAKLGRTGTQVWLTRPQYGDEGHSAATALVYRRLGSDRRLFLTGSATGLMSTRQNMLIAALNANTGAKVHHLVVDGDGADDGGEALVVDATGHAYAAGWTTSAASHVVHALVARMNPDGALAWEKPLWLAPGDNEAYFEAIDLDAAGNVICGGYGVQPGLGPEAWVQSLYPTDGERWTNVSSGSASSVDICRSVLANASGVFAAGQISRTGSGVDGQLKKIEP